MVENAASSQELFQSVKNEGINAALLLAKNQKKPQNIDSKEKSPREKKKERAKLQLEKVGLTSEQKADDAKQSVVNFLRMPPYLFPEGLLAEIKTYIKWQTSTNFRKDEELLQATKESIVSQQDVAKRIQDIKNAQTRKLDEGETEEDRKREIEYIMTTPISSGKMPEEIKNMDLSKIDAFPVDEDCRRFFL